MKRRNNFFISLLITAAIILTSCSDGNIENTEEIIKSINVEAQVLTSKNYTDYVKAVGTFKPFNDAKVAHEAGGIIKEIVKDKGQYVKKGDTILILDNDVLKASMEAAKAQFDLAEARFQRQEKVFSDNVGSEFEYLNTKYNRDQLKAVYEQAKVIYEKSFVKAPFNGVVDARYYEEGEFVPPAVPVVRVIEHTRLKIEAGIPERLAAHIKLGAEVLVFIKELYDQPIVSKVNYVGKALDPSNRTFPIEVTIDNKSGLIKPNMLAEISVSKGEFENVVIIPEEVVTKSDDGYIVFVANNGKAEIRYLDILSRTAEFIVVRNGLNPGDQLITMGFQNLVDGEHISIVN